LQKQTKTYGFRHAAAHAAMVGLCDCGQPPAKPKQDFKTMAKAVTEAKAKGVKVSP